MRRREPLPTPANPGAGSAVTVYDSAGVPNQQTLDRAYDRVRVFAHTDVTDMVLKVEVAATETGTLRTLKTTTITSPPLLADVLLSPGRTKISLVTTTNPTTFEVAAEKIDGQALGM